VLHDQEAIGERRGEAEVLLDHDDRVALLAQAFDDLAELLHDDRRQALGDLVEQEQARAGAQDARDGEHLLLAARQARALARRALLQVREHRVDLLEAHAVRAERRRQHQVLLGRQAREDAALLGAVADAEAGDAVRREVRGLGVLDLDRALARADQAHDRAQRAGPAGAVPAEQRHDLAFVDVEVDAVQHVRLAVPAVQVADLEEAGPSQCAPASSACEVPM
jgi:hypothetical protein